MNELLKLTVTELSDGLRRKRFSSSELTEAYLKQIEATDGFLGAYITVTAEKAKDAAKLADFRLSQGNAHPLCGIPTAYKDNLCTKGIRTTCASKMLENFIPPYSATAVSNLEKAGAVMLGKLNMDEFAMGSTCETSAFRTTLNPVAHDRVPGGSSGGCAAAVIASEAPYSIGTDTGGSIRLPAAFCGAVGMKPTYGRVSRFGLIAFASSLDQAGIITRTVRDNALIMSALTAHDGKDPSHIPLPHEDFSREISLGLKGMRLGIAPEFFGSNISSEILKCINDAVIRCTFNGAETIDIQLPALKYALPAYYVISSAEASSNLARFDGVRYGYRSENSTESITELYLNSRSEAFGDEVKRRIILGTFVLSEGYRDDYYKKALSVRTLIKNNFEDAFGKCDVIIAPVAPTAAYKLGSNKVNPLDTYSGDLYTVPSDLAGLPAISVPCGKNADGLPVGVQIIGRPFSEATIYRVAETITQ